MRYSVFRLKFRNGIHIGDGRQNEYTSSANFLHSDTMYAALTATEALIRELPDPYAPEWVISSLFPFTEYDGLGHIQYSYFFPRPIYPILTRYEDNIQYDRKKLKEIKWIDKPHFEKLLNGELLAPSDLANNVQKAFLLSESRNGWHLPYENDLTDRVTIPRDRENEDPTPFAFDVLRFRENSGLYFLTDQNSADRISHLLDLLKDRGLGTDRNLGYGHFNFERDEMELNVPNDANAILNLGLIVPNTINDWNDWTSPVDTVTEMSTKIQFYPGYQLIKRGGWITTSGASSMKKGSVYMIEEGAVLNSNGINISLNQTLALGNPSIDLAPSRIEWKDLPSPILRCGKAIVLPFKISRHAFH